MRAPNSVIENATSLHWSPRKQSCEPWRIRARLTAITTPLEQRLRRINGGSVSGVRAGYGWGKAIKRRRWGAEASRLRSVKRGTWYRLFWRTVLFVHSECSDQFVVDSWEFLAIRGCGSSVRRTCDIYIYVYGRSSNIPCVSKLTRADIYRLSEVELEDARRRHQVFCQGTNNSFVHPSRPSVHPPFNRASVSDSSQDR